MSLSKMETAALVAKARWLEARDRRNVYMLWPTSQPPVATDCSGLEANHLTLCLKLQNHTSACRGFVGVLERRR